MHSDCRVPSAERATALTAESIITVNMRYLVINRVPKRWRTDSEEGSKLSVADIRGDAECERCSGGSERGRDEKLLSGCSTHPPTANRSAPSTAHPPAHLPSCLHPPCLFASTHQKNKAHHVCVSTLVSLFCPPLRAMMAL